MEYGYRLCVGRSGRDNRLGRQSVSTGIPPHTSCKGEISKDYKERSEADKKDREVRTFDTVCRDDKLEANKGQDLDSLSGESSVLLEIMALWWKMFEMWKRNAKEIEMFKRENNELLSQYQRTDMGNMGLSRKTSTKEATIRGWNHRCPLPVGWKNLSLDKYEDTTDLDEHIDAYIIQVKTYSPMMMPCVPNILEGGSSELTPSSNIGHANESKVGGGRVTLLLHEMRLDSSHKNQRLESGGDSSLHD
ncbi:hypothetical protein CR513_35328, partial [Mucuna pruriens]